MKVEGSSKGLSALVVTDPERDGTKQWYESVLGVAAYLGAGRRHP